MRLEDKVFEGLTMTIDGNSYIRCAFLRCTLVYSGGVEPSFVDCRLSETGFTFVEQAARTISFLRAMYHGGFKVVVDATWQDITTPYPEDGEANVKQD